MPRASSSTPSCSWRWPGASGTAPGRCSSPRPCCWKWCVTAADFVVEDRTRRLPAFERVLHTVLTLLFGVLLMAIAPRAARLVGSSPRRVVATDYGGIFRAAHACSPPAWPPGECAMRSRRSRHFRPAEWVRDPIESAPTRPPAAACWSPAPPASSAATWCARCAARRCGLGMDARCRSRAGALRSARARGDERWRTSRRRAHRRHRRIWPARR